MRILVTGGNGYIGTNILMRFNDEMSEHIEVDACDYGIVYPDLPLAHQLSFSDIAKYDAIVHLAALSGIIACEENPQSAVQENILTAMNVFKHATKAGIPVVFTSSQAAKNPTSSKYAFIKWSCEQMAYLYNNEGGMNYVLRLSNVYGGHEYLEKKQTIVKQFITRYLKGQPLLIHGDGTQTRDFIHVDDVIDAIMRVFAMRPTIKEPMDIGTGRPLSIMQVQEMFPRKQNQHYEFEKERSAGASSSIANLTLAKDLLAFEAKRNLRDYIKEMIS